jgi:hypothetical protein
MRFKLLPVWTFTMLAVAGTAFGQADQLVPPAGGKGGGQYFARCALGEILNGFELRTGDDVDAIRPICAVPYSKSAIGPRIPYPQSFGGTGGAVTRIVCPDNAPAIAAMFVAAEGESTTVVNNIWLYCSEAVPNLPKPEYPSARFDGEEIGRTGDGWFAQLILLPAKTIHLDPHMQHCPDGLVPVGINGRSGIWLDSLGLTCGALRIAPPDPNAVKSIGRVGSPSAPRPARHICDAARDARARNSPAAPNLEAQCQAAPQPAPPPATPQSAPAPAAITPADLQMVMARGIAIANNDPLATELRNRLFGTGNHRGFDLGMGIWAGNTAPGPGKDRYRNMLPPFEQGGFDIAAAFSLPRNKYSLQSSVGAAIASADPAVAAARAAGNDPFFLLGFDIASGIFGDRAAGAQGNTATGPGSLAIRNELNAAGQRGFDASTSLHLARRYH